jgi:hypothetical protein
MKPAAVLEKQAELAERYVHPSDLTLKYIKGFAEHTMYYRGQGNQQMFYPTRPVDDKDQARLFAQLTGADLLLGATYQVTAKMTDLLQEIFATTVRKMAEREEQDRIEAAHLPSERGFIWFDKPVEFRDRRGNMVSMRAFSWGAQTIRDEVAGAYGQPVEIIRDGLRLVIWNCIYDPNDYDFPLHEISRYGDLQIDHVMAIALGEPYPVMPEVKGEKGRGDSILHYVVVTWALLQSEVTVQRRPRPDMPRFRRRAGKTLRHSEVTVITLRKAIEDDLSRPRGHRRVDWSCRWIVAGFWRHSEEYDTERYRSHHRPVVVGRRESGQDHCDVCGARVSWVRSHMKGPSWLPVKESKVVSRLAR